MPSSLEADLEPISFPLEASIPPVNSPMFLADFSGRQCLEQLTIVCQCTGWRNSSSI